MKKDKFGMGAFPDNFPLNNHYIKKRISLSKKLTWIPFILGGVPISFFMVTQMFIIFSIPLPSPLSSGASGVIGTIMNFIYQWTWGITNKYSLFEIGHALLLWGAINFLLYAFIGIVAVFRYIRHYKPREDIDEFDDMVMDAFYAIKQGPAYAISWIKKDYFQKVLADRKYETLLGKALNLQQYISSALLLKRLMDTYIDLKFQGISNPLTLKLKFLKLVGLVFWGIYPYAKALEQNVDTTIEEMLSKQQYIEYIERIDITVKQHVKNALLVNRQ